MRLIKVLSTISCLLLILMMAAACSSTCDPCSFGEWSITKAPTCEAAGEEARTCSLCGAVERRTVAKLDAAFSIVQKVGGKETSIPVAADGMYTLTAPERTGFSFVGWIDGNGSPFPASGVIGESVTVTAVFEILETATFADLKARVEGGADEVLITADILLSETIYVTNAVTIYVTDDCTLQRSPDFGGVLFLLGEDAAGRNIILDGKQAHLVLRGTEGGTLTLDGNKEGLNVTVEGSAILLANGSVLDIYDGVAILDHKKLSNSAQFMATDYSISESAVHKVGGAAVTVTSGVFNMYGGRIAGNEVSTKDSTNTDEAARAEGYDISCLGGAIFNYGTFNMHGGEISENSAARGGAVYNYRIANIYGGALKSNTAAAYGGALYLPDSQLCYANIGVSGTEEGVLIEGNTATLSGGALFIQHQSAVAVHGSTAFKGNRSLTSNGGAINCAGELVVEYAVFSENFAASKGGAIYAYYSAPTYTMRVVNIKAGLFAANEASRGGAIALGQSGDAAVSAACSIGGVEFRENKAFLVEGSHGNGGALYSSGAGVFRVSGAARFIENTAEAKGGAVYLTTSSALHLLGTVDSAMLFRANQAADNGGAIYMYTTTALTADHVSFLQNSATSGGAIYITNSAGAEGTKSAATLHNAVFDGNSATYRGGALYITSTAELTAAALTLTENTATDAGGAVYVMGSVMTVTDLIATGNKAGANGGALYLTSSSHTTLQSSEAGASVLSQNSSVGGSGGAIALHTTSTLSLFGITFTQNSSLTADGGALYVRNSTVTLGDATHPAVNTFSQNSAKGNGGAIYLDTTSSDTYLYAYTLVLTKNTAKGGGALYATSDNTEDIVTVDVKALTATENSSTQNGGAFYIYYYCVVNIDTLTATDNTAGLGGGVFYISQKPTVTIGTVTATGNRATGETDPESSSAAKGGLIYMTVTGTSVTLISGSISENAAANGGASVYSNSAKALLYLGDALTYPAGSVTGASGFAAQPMEA